MKKNIRIVLITLLIMLIIGGNCFADVILPGQSHGEWRRNIKYENTTSTPSIWTYILIGLTIISIVIVVILIILKKSKNKKEKELNGKTDNK